MTATTKKRMRLGYHYFYIHNGSVRTTIECRTRLDDALYDHGNYYATKTDAALAANKKLEA